MTFASASQFHVYLLWVNACLALCLKCENTTRHSRPREGPSRGLLCDCEIFTDLYVCSSIGGGWWDGSRDQVHLVDPVSCYISRLAATLHRDVSDIRASVVKYIYTISTRGLV